MKIKQIETEGYASNCYLVISGEEAAIVDPSAEISDIELSLKNEKVKLKYILLTHGHFDHMLSLAELREKFSVPLCIQRNDAVALTDPSRSLFTLLGQNDKTFAAAEILFEDGDTISLGDEEIKVIHTPGHTSGSVCYICGDDVITGDTLFDMNIGRCDLSGSDSQAILPSIKRLYSLCPNACIYPGHGAASTIEKQKKHNPYTRSI